MLLKKIVKRFLWIVACCWAGVGHSQDLYWTLHGKGANVRINDVAVDHQGNSYVTGSYEGQLELDGVVFNSKGGEDIFLAKTSPDGQVQWAITIGSDADFESGNAVGVTANGANVYITGKAANGAQFGTQTLTTGNPNGEFFLLSVNGNNGQVAWLQHSLTTNGQTSEGFDLDVDPVGNVAVTGRMGQGNFSGQMANDPLQAFVAFFDPSGSMVWTNFAVIANVQANLNRAVAVDDNGAIYAMGEFTESISWKGQTLALTVPGVTASYLLQFDALTGNLNWLNSPSGSETNPIYTNGLAANSSGAYFLQSGNAAFVDGAARTVVWLAKVRLNGTIEWVQSPAGCTGLGVNTGAFGGLALGGDEAIYMSSLAGNGFVVSKYTQDSGAFRGEQLIGDRGTGGAVSLGIAANATGQTWVGGFFFGTVDFGQTTLSSTANFPDGFLTKVVEGYIVDVKLPVAQVCKGSTVELTFTASGFSDPNNVFTIEISDPSGDFSAPTVLGTVTGTNGVFVKDVTFPDQLTDSPSYKIRVVSSSPVVTGKCNEFAVAVQENITVEAGDDLQVCEDQTVVQIPAGQPLGGEWSGIGITDESGVFNALLAGVGKVTLRYTFQQGQCLASDTIVVEVLPFQDQFTITPDATVELCPGESDTLRVNSVPGAVFTWKKDGADLVNTNDSLLIVRESGFYSVQINTACGVFFSDNLVEVIVEPALPDFVIKTNTPLPLCLGQKAQLDAPPAMGVTYEWFKDGQPLNVVGNSFQADQPGIYTALARNRCEEKQSNNEIEVNVITLQRPTLAATPAAVVCEGQPIVLRSNITTGLSFAWRRNGQPIAGADTDTLSVTTEGFYQIAITTQCGVTVSDSLRVNAFSNTPPVIRASSTVFCGSPLQLETDVVSGATYRWLRDGQPVGTNSPVLAVNQPGTYSIEVTTPCGTQASNIPVQIVEEALPTPVALNGERCGPGSVALAAEPVAAPRVRYAWYASATATTPLAVTSLPSWETPPLSQSTVFFMAVLSVSGCESPRVANEAVVHPLPQIVISPDAYIAEGASVTLSAEGGLTYLWQPAAGLDDPTSPNPVATSATTTTYEVTVTSREGCTATASVTVFVKENLSVPNTMTPNNDGINDTWEIKGIQSHPGAKIRVFNRWGQTVYESVGYEQPFDGTRGGGQLPVDTYFYTIELGDDYRIIKGTISIIR